MNNKIQHYHWHWQLSSTPEQLWPHLTDIDRLNRALKRPPVYKSDVQEDADSAYPQFSYDRINNFDAWEEEPFQWEYPYRYSVRRRYLNGAYREMTIRVDLTPNAEGTLISYQIWVSPRNIYSRIATTFRLGIRYRNRLKSVLKQIDYLAAHNLATYPSNNGQYLSRANKKKIKAIHDRLIENTGDMEAVNRLVEYLGSADDADLRNLNPNILATQWNLSRKRLIEVFFYAVKSGLLNFNWELYCPDCRTVQKNCITLSEIHEPIHCNDCDKEFYINFDRSLQLSFRPDPSIRKISDARYSFTGPQTRPHIVVRQFLKVGEKRYLKTNLPEGTYQLRASNLEGRITVHVTDDAESNVSITMTDEKLNNPSVDLFVEPNLVIENRSSSEQIITLENIEWDTKTVTAAEATSLQLFRDLFENEVINKGEKISVKNLTLMFTDLLDSTGMYQKEGDQQAVGRVIEHFEVLQEVVARENGAIVKTIGDSIMAVFSSPLHAVKAFVKARRVIAEDTRFRNSLKLKAGIHTGKCVAVNLNNKIDYFGSMVNIASRLVEFAEENECVLSENVSRSKEVADYLSSGDWGCTVEDINAHLKGFNYRFFRVKRITTAHSPLRLVI
ncbi:MAG: adenylate/guanylate cyclase domain-containing protein [Balneolaceae bacterium]|nr:adenylate/guanylate cyclase domain-containing protein [Balneolaceae bacterium]